MLNAFRHHRNSHTRGVFPDDISVSAQRLSASSEFALDYRRPSCPRVTLVLNAFRHHRNSHLFPNKVRASQHSVLNAFRHHRNSHPCQPSGRWSLQCAQRLSASSEFAPSKRYVPRPSLHVLNAFRHHRNSHVAELADVAEQMKSAQRLSASSEFAPSQRLGRQCRSQCAQRLSASSEFAPQRCTMPLSSIGVLNAFRHHRNSHSVGSNPPVCHRLPACFRASLRFTLTTSSFTLIVLVFECQSPQESDT